MFYNTVETLVSFSFLYGSREWSRLPVMLRNTISTSPLLVHRLVALDKAACVVLLKSSSFATRSSFLFTTVYHDRIGRSSLCASLREYFGEHLQSADLKHSGDAGMHWCRTLCRAKCKFSEPLNLTATAAMLTGQKRLAMLQECHRNLIADCPLPIHVGKPHWQRTQSSLSRSSKSSSSQPPFRLWTTTFSASCCCSLTALRMSLSCASVTRARSCPLRASMMSLFSTSSAREAFTKRMRPSLSAASGSRI